MLEIGELTAGYQGGSVLHGVDLSVPEGTVHALLGANGAGKSTLIHTVAGLLKPSGGRVELAGVDLTGRPAHRVSHAGIGLVPQGRRVFASLTVAEHLRLAHRKHAAWTPARILELLPRLGERAGNRGSQLSGGEQQMLAIARALLGGPRLVLLDEPTEGLSPVIAEQIRQLITTLAGEGLTILIAAPQLGFVQGIADRLTVLSTGRVTARMTAAEAEADPEPILAALAPGVAHVG
ncbi:ABC transporter ATP-binding protein [Embleya hyalina]|uniref:ABC transporter ATP-binding protein n=1 Tax=Embleya hyalina TaxID=516124 RepID=A0A401YS86_9ACTN|nr:ABC transporter ATP-binding protein [Embleya hyalina]GCD97464.1 ABC transporter ATP-binding protein [Embleya hyalina]